MDTQETIEKLREWEQRLSASPLPFDRELGYLFRSALTHLEGAQADKARLEWVVENEAYIEEVARKDFQLFLPAGEVYAGHNPVDNGGHETFRDAIDSAMAAQPTQTSV